MTANNESRLWVVGFVPAALGVVFMVVGVIPPPWEWASLFWPF